MKITQSLRNLLVLVVAGSLAVLPVAAKDKEDKGEKHGNKQAQKAEKREMKAEKREMKAEKKAAKARREDIKAGTYFTSEHRTRVTTYYSQHYGGGKACPPGLAKKNNGCLPPGQAKKLYVVGQPLPTTVRYYSVPQPVLVTLPPAPVGYRYVSVGGDIVLLALGTMMVVDALDNLLR